MTDDAYPQTLKHPLLIKKIDEKEIIIINVKKSKSHFTK